VKKFISDFGKALLALAGVVGLFVAAAAFHHVAIAVLVVAIALAWALVRLVPKGVRTLQVWVRQIRSYPQLLDRAATLTDELQEAQREVTSFRDAMAAKHEEGVREGQMQFVGALLAAGIKESPEIVAASRDGDAVMLIARSDSPKQFRVGARVTLEVVGTGKTLGVLQVVGSGEDDGLIHLSCVKPVDEAFWGRLAQQVDSDPSPPGGVKLVPTQFSLPDVLERLRQQRKEKQ
jgi:hypothetical protein